jgi:formamidopyrimidine-DNA glycosylase
MPELPDVELYRSHLQRRFVGQKLVGIRFASPFVLRTYAPKPDVLVGRKLVGVERLGKRIVFAFEGDFFFVVHLMISGRFRLRDAGTKPPGKLGLAAIDFPSHTVLLTEASTHKRASIHVLEGRTALRAMDPGGLEPLEIDLASFRARLLEGNHTLKRALTDPRHFSGIGNAYSDELLHRAKLSPIKVVSRLGEAEIDRLFHAMRDSLQEWTERLAKETGDAFPETVTAFRPEMAVHGKYGEPCPVCGTNVQRIRYANNEANYCPECQTEGKLLADRALSRLLGKEWPKSLEELEMHKEARKVGASVSTEAAATPKKSAPPRASRKKPSGRLTEELPSPRPKSSSSRPKSGA